MVLKKPLSGLGTDKSQLAIDLDTVNTHLFLIKSQMVVDKVLANLQSQGQLETLSTFANGQPPRETLLRAIRTSSYGMNRENRGPTLIIDVSVQAASADDATRLLQEVVSSYRDVLREITSSPDSRTEQLARERDDLAASLGKWETTLRETQAKNGGMPPAQEKLQETQRHLSELESRRFAAQVERAEVQGRLDAFEKKWKDGPVVGARLMVAEWAAKVKFDQLPSDVKVNTDIVQAFRDTLQQQIDDLADKEKTLTKLLEGEQARLEQCKQRAVQEETLREQIKESRERFTTAFRRCEEVSRGQHLIRYEVYMLAPPSLRKAVWGLPR